MNKRYKLTIKYNGMYDIEILRKLFDLSDAKISDSRSHVTYEGDYCSVLNLAKSICEFNDLDTDLYIKENIVLISV